MQTRYIDTPQALQALCDELHSSSWLALDTEFLRERTFHPQLCLIQVSNGEFAACVDPLALENLDPLLDLIYDTTITKVMHAARQDLEIFLNLRGTLPYPVFDTQIAATVLGYGDQVGYGALVKLLLDVDLDKSQTRTDWSQRPLDPDQITYAADDVRYLCAVFERITEQLLLKGRNGWLEEDFAALTNPSSYAIPLEEAWQRIKGAGKLKGAQLAVLRALAAWREARAREQDRPRRWVLKDESLLELARQMPDTLARLERVRGLEPHVLRLKSELVEVIAAARRLPRTEWPVLDLAERLTPAQEAVVDLMMGVLRQRGAAQGVSPLAIASRRDLEQVMLGREDVPVLHGWRSAVAGETLRALRDGRLGVHVHQGELVLQPLEAAII